ncbi:PREDICTED: putative RNA-binding protein Luc7-like 1 isoform X4 [Propithecus coquereli]|nr:PREDICTED: putative RNA-binding protein Luc7-like 1 isoform X4 [Propithecus coquereli]
MDLGECTKIHDLALRADYEIASKERDLFFELDAMDHLESFIAECDRRTELAKKRLAETQEEISAEVSAKAEKVHELNEEIGKLLAKAEQLGAEGNVDESQKILMEVEKVRAKKKEAEEEYRNSMPASSFQQQKLRVCEVCSAYLGLHDNDRRLADHFGGKLHLGFIQIREKLDQLRKTVAEKQEKRNQDRLRRREEREREERLSRRSGSRTRDRRRSRSRDRRRRRSRSASRERRKSSRSRSRDRHRRHRSRSRSHSRGHRRASRDRSAKYKGVSAILELSAHRAHVGTGVCVLQPPASCCGRCSACGSPAAACDSLPRPADSTGRGQEGVSCAGPTWAWCRARQCHRMSLLLTSTFSCSGTKDMGSGCVLSWSRLPIPKPALWEWLWLPGPWVWLHPGSPGA